MIDYTMGVLAVIALPIYLGLLTYVFARVWFEAKLEYHHKLFHKLQRETE
jgi:hypothetical protein